MIMSKNVNNLKCENALSQYLLAHNLKLYIFTGKEAHFIKLHDFVQYSNIVLVELMKFI